MENNFFLVRKRVRIFENRAARTLACENIRFSLLFAAGDVSPRNVPSGEGNWGTTQRNSNWSLRKTKIIVSFWKNKETRPRFLVLANFGACLSPEKPRDIAYISSIFKHMQRWWVSWIRSIYWFFFFFFFSNGNNYRITYKSLIKSFYLYSRLNKSTESSRWVWQVWRIAAVLHWLGPSLYPLTMPFVHTGEAKCQANPCLGCYDEKIILKLLYLNSYKKSIFFSFYRCIVCSTNYRTNRTWLLEVNRVSYNFTSLNQ